MLTKPTPGPDAFYCPSRPLREHVPGGFYYATSVANHGESLFADEADRQVLGALIQEAILLYVARVHAFCWMPDRIDFFIQIAEVPLGKIMQRILSRYALHRHKPKNTTGHTFRQHHYAKLTARIDFKETVRAIHRLPIEAGLVRRPEQYEWSSHQAYLGRQYIPWLTTGYGLSLFRGAGDTRHNFARFVERTAAPDTTITAFEMRQPRQSSPGPDSLTLTALAQRLCARHSISPALLCSRSKQPSVSRVRSELAKTAIAAGIATQAEVARFLRRHPAAITRLLATAQLDNVAGTARSQ